MNRNTLSGCCCGNMGCGGKFPAEVRQRTLDEIRYEELMEFIVWLSPLGQLEGGPTPEMIGARARELLA